MPRVKMIITKAILYRKVGRHKSQDFPMTGTELIFGKEQQFFPTLGMASASR